MIANYHTHTRRCFHAVGADEQYVRAAIDSGLETLGFSDHGPWPYKGFVSTMRMTVRQAPGYIKSIKKLREKYKDKIDIKVGFEYEYFPAYIDWLREFKEKNGIDYLILGHHYFPEESSGVCTGIITKPEELYEYAGSLIEGMKSGLFLYVCHPDMFMVSYPEFDEHCEEVSHRICKAAQEIGIPIEYNILGMRKSEKAGHELYPHSSFWKIAREYDVRVVIGIDAHSPKHITDNAPVIRAENYLKENGFNVVKKRI